MPINLSGSGWTATVSDDLTASITGTVPDTMWSFPVFKPGKNPDLRPSFSEEPILHTVQFGDGYSQVGPKGLNHIDMNLRLSWGLLSYAEEDAIRAFFRERGGNKPFWYAVPGDSYRLWRCGRWSGGETINQARSLSADFIRAVVMGV